MTALGIHRTEDIFTIGQVRTSRVGSQLGIADERRGLPPECWGRR